MTAALAGCAGAPPPAPPAEPAPRAETRTIGTSVEGRPIRLLSFGEGPETVLILATIHGNEAAGTPLVLELARRLPDEPALLAGRRVLIVPEANPDGRAGNRRTNARGVDLNRNFPADNFAGSERHGEEPLSQPESRALEALIRDARPARIVSLHQPLACIDHDGPAAALAEAMSRSCGLPAKKLGGRPGSLGSWAGITLGIPIVTFELPRSADDLSVEELWSRYGSALMVFIATP